MSPFIAEYSPGRQTRDYDESTEVRIGDQRHEHPIKEDVRLLLYLIHIIHASTGNQILPHCQPRFSEGTQIDNVRLEHCRKYAILYRISKRDVPH